MIAKKEISLLPAEENLNSPGARILRWLTTIGRFVIVFTELIVICAFISRFWLDRQNADLSEIIRQQKAILETTKDFEDEYSLLQGKLKTIKDLALRKSDYGTKINSLVNSTPSDIIYDDLTISKQNQKITATVSLTVLKETSITDFIANLTLNPDIETVDIQKIEKKPRENKYSIDIFVIFKDA